MVMFVEIVCAKVAQLVEHSPEEGRVPSSILGLGTKKLVYNVIMNRTDVEVIKERLPINEVVGSYVKLEKSGSSFKGKCPFHNEKTPSFFVSPDRGGYYCFGCNAKGDIFSFVEQFEGLDFRGALKILAERAGVRLTFNKKSDGERDKLFQIMEVTTQFFESQLEKSKEVNEYLKKRGVSEKTCADFRIGWAPEGWDSLYKHLKDKGYDDLLIERAGLIKKKDNGGVGYYDRFRGRIIFPINDSSGRVIAFSGRILKDDGKSAKYLNSPDTSLYDKSLVLYGLDKAKSDIRRMGYSILVEGQMDLIMSHQAGIKNTVASSGTALTDESFSETGAVSNLGLIRRLSQNIIIAFDSDTAGRKAAMRASGIALSMGMDVKIADLVGGKDPADLVLNNSDDWKNVLRKAKPIIEFELGNVLRDVPDARKLPRALRERVFPFLARIESRMDQAHFVKMISDNTNITETAIWDDLKNVKIETLDPKSKVQNTSKMQNIKSEMTHLDLVERRMFGLLILIEKANLSTAKEYREQIMKIADSSYSERILRIEPLINDLTFEAEAFFGSDPKEWDHHMKELIMNFEENLISEELIVSMNELRIAEKAGESIKVADLVKKYQVLSIRKAEIGKRRRN